MTNTILSNAAEVSSSDREFYPEHSLASFRHLNSQVSFTPEPVTFSPLDYTSNLFNYGSQFYNRPGAFSIFSHPFNTGYGAYSNITSYTSF